MIGIPFTIRRQNERGQVEDEVVYLQSRRRGPTGESMRQHLRNFMKARFEQQRASSRAGMALAKAGLAMTGPEIGTADDAEGRRAESRLAELEKLDASQEKEMQAAQASAATCIAEAEEVARLALSDNYGAERAGDIIDKLTDRELNWLVETIEMGAMPADFFTSRGTPPKPSSTVPSGSEPAKPSSAPVIPDLKSSAAP